jgi:hypothetical protein
MCLFVSVESRRLVSIICQGQYEFIALLRLLQECNTMSFLGRDIPYARCDTDPLDIGPMDDKILAASWTEGPAGVLLKLVYAQLKD